MTKLFQRTGVIGLAFAVAFAITAIGQGLWGVMTIVNVKFTPAIPWAPAVMPLILLALGLFLAGRIGPKKSRAARRALVPMAPVSVAAWFWSLAAGFAGIIALAALWTVLTSLVATPPNLLPDASAIPLNTAIPMLLVSIVAAPLTEEIAFRGYAMGMLRRHFGPIAAIVISSVMFMAAHLTQGLYPTKLVVYLLVGLALAVTVWRTGSLLPAAIVHSFGDFVFFTAVWPHDVGRHLVSQTGLDAAFLTAVATLVVFTGLWFVGFRQLLRVTDGRRGSHSPGLVASVA